MNDHWFEPALTALSVPASSADRICFQPWWTRLGPSSLPKDWRIFHVTCFS